MWSRAREQGGKRGGEGWVLWTKRFQCAGCIITVSLIVLTRGISDGLIEFITRRVYTFRWPFCSNSLEEGERKIWGYTTLLFLFHFLISRNPFFSIRCKITKKLYRNWILVHTIILPSQIDVPCVTPCRQPKLSGGLHLWNTCKGCPRQSWSRFCSSTVCRSLLVQLCHIAGKIIPRQYHIWKYSIDFSSSIVSNSAAKLK